MKSLLDFVVRPIFSVLAANRAHTYVVMYRAQFHRAIIYHHHAPLQKETIMVARRDAVNIDTHAAMR